MELSDTITRTGVLISRMEAQISAIEDILAGPVDSASQADAIAIPPGLIAASSVNVDRASKLSDRLETLLGMLRPSQKVFADAKQELRNMPRPYAGPAMVETSERVYSGG